MASLTLPIPSHHVHRESELSPHIPPGDLPLLHYVVKRSRRRERKRNAGEQEGTPKDMASFLLTQVPEVSRDVAPMLSGSSVTVPTSIDDIG